MTPAAIERARRAAPADMAPLYAALAAAQAEFPAIGKTKTGHGYRYADLADVLDAVRPVLSRHGLCVMQRVQGDDLVTTLGHASGAAVDARYPLVQDGTGRMNAIQRVGASLTYARRYALAALLGIAPDDDTDGAEPQRPAQRQEQPAPPPPPPFDAAEAEKRIAAGIAAAATLDALRGAWMRETDAIGRLKAEAPDALARLTEAKDAAKAKLNQPALEGDEIPY